VIPISAVSFSLILIGLCLLILLIRLNHVYTNFGKIKMLYAILKHNCMELEVAVKVCVKNISKLVYCKVFIRCGHRGFGLRSSTPFTSTHVRQQSTLLFSPCITAAKLILMQGMCECE